MLAGVVPSGVLLCALGPVLAAFVGASEPQVARWADGAIVVAMPVDDAPVVLFEDERRRLRERVAETLRAKGHAVVPVAELEVIETAALAGRLLPEGDRRCRTALRRSEIANRWFRAHPIARVHANCDDDDCRLHVDFEARSQGSAIQLFYASARVRTPGRPGAWIAAAARLHETADTYGHLWGLSLSSHPPPITFSRVHGTGPWKGEVPSDPFTAVEERAASCAHPDPFVQVEHELRATIDPRGRVQRCEWTSESANVRPADRDCLCASLAEVRMPVGRAGRRLRVSAEDPVNARRLSAATSTATWTATTPETEDWVERLRESAVLDRCRDVVLPSKLKATVTIAMRDDGTIDDVHVGGVGRAAENMQFVACVADELRSVALPCLAPDQHELVVHLAADATPRIDSVPFRR